MVDAHAGLRLHPGGRQGSPSCSPGSVRRRRAGGSSPRAPRASCPTRHTAQVAGRKWASFNGRRRVQRRQPAADALAAARHHARSPYRGALRATQGTTINILPLDSYVQGVVAREVPAEVARPRRCAPRRSRPAAATPRTSTGTALDDVLRHLRHLPRVRSTAASPRRAAGVQPGGPPQDAQPRGHPTRAGRRSRSSPPATAAGARPGRSPTWLPSRTRSRRRRPTRTPTGPPPSPAHRSRRPGHGVGVADRPRPSPATAPATSAAGSRQGGASPASQGHAAR